MKNTEKIITTGTKNLQIYTPENTHGLSQKIQGTYFKISALYFKIYALYFSPFGMLETQRLTKPEKQAFAGIGKRIRKRANGNALRP